MQFYLAPLEGITGYVYRNAYEKFFHNVERYYTPFLAPNKNQSFTSREQNDVLPAHNMGMDVVPQILTNQGKHFIHTAKMLEQLGYREVNLNLGCPSATVVSKKKGAGFLAAPDVLEHFFEEIFAGTPVNISVKTRIGVDRVEEFGEILDVFNQFPIKELIIHPRLQKDLYGNKPDWSAFAQAVKMSRAPLCYNGDIFTVADYERFCDEFPAIETIMLGRGILRNPGLVDEIRSRKDLDYFVLKQFHDEILQGYRQAFSGDKPVLYKMRELWAYMLPLFSHGAEYKKKICKAERIRDYQISVEALFQSELYVLSKK